MDRRHLHDRRPGQPRTGRGAPAGLCRPGQDAMRSSISYRAITVDYLSRQIEAGVDAVQLFDSWSGSLAPAQFERWSSPAPHGSSTSSRSVIPIRR